MIRAKDTSGNYSAIAYQRTTVSALPDIDIIEVIKPEDTNWPGTVSGFTKNGSVLEMTGPWTPADPVTGAGGYREAVYNFHTVTDFGAVYESMLQERASGYGRITNRFMVDWVPIATQIPLAGTAVDDYDYWVEYRTSDSSVVMADWVPNIADPIADPIAGVAGDSWSEWRRFKATDITARYVQYRLVARSYRQNVQVVMTSGEVEVDMPDTYRSEDDVQIVAAGTDIVFDPAFYQSRFSGRNH